MQIPAQTQIPIENDFRQYLQNELIRRTRANPRYSLRAFARSLQTDFSSLGKIIRGKRPLGKNTILRLGTRMGLGSQEIEIFVIEAQNKKMSQPRATQKQSSTYQQLAVDQHQIIADWYHHAILELLRIDGFEATEKNVSRALGLSVIEVKAAVERLVRVGLVGFDETGKWQDLSADGRTTGVVAMAPTIAARNLQKQVLEKAIVAIEEIPFEKRDNSSMTIAIDSDLMDEAKAKIAKFRRELSQFLSRGKKRDRVYHLGIALYPVSEEQGLQEADSSAKAG